MEQNLKHLADCVNRSDNQIKQLFDLCDKDFDKLLELEAKIKKYFISYCPKDKKEVEEILNLKTKSSNKIDSNRCGDGHWPGLPFTI